MSESGYNEGCVELVKVGYADSIAAINRQPRFENRCLTFTARFYVGTRDAFHDLWKALHAVKYYNGFSAGRIIAVFRELEGVTGTIPGVFAVRFGREYSPVLYLECDSKERAKELVKAFDYARPDECDRKGKTVRLWWD